MPILAADYLHNNEDNHDKVYNVQLEQNGNRYHVVAEYGRRLGVLKRITKYSGLSHTEATAEYGKLIREKVGKGYSRVGRTQAGTTGIGTPTPIPESKPAKSKSKTTEPAPKPKPEPEVFNPNFIPERRLDFDDL